MLPAGPCVQNTYTIRCLSTPELNDVSVISFKAVFGEGLQAPVVVSAAVFSDGVQVAVDPGVERLKGVQSALRGTRLQHLKL